MRLSSVCQRDSSSRLARRGWRGFGPDLGCRRGARVGAGGGSVAGKGGVGVGGVVAPGLVGAFEEGFDVGAASVEKGAEDFPFGT